MKKLRLITYLFCKYFVQCVEVETLSLLKRVLESKWTFHSTVSQLSGVLK